MSFLPRPSRPSAAFRDLFAFMRQRSREQLIGACLALLVTAIIVIEFVVDSNSIARPDPQVVEVDLYSPKRTDAQIAADQKRDQAAKQAADKEQQRQMKQLAKQLGID
jgi:microcompartment protein CcmL/EutN